MSFMPLRCPSEIWLGLWNWFSRRCRVYRNCGRKPVSQLARKPWSLLGYRWRGTLLPDSAAPKNCHSERSRPIFLFLAKRMSACEVEDLCSIARILRDELSSADVGVATPGLTAGIALANLGNRLTTL